MFNTNYHSYLYLQLETIEIIKYIKYKFGVER